MEARSVTQAFHIKLHCRACDNRTTVNLEGFTAKRALLLDQEMRSQECALCKCTTLDGAVHPGSSPDAKMVVKDGPVTWSKEALDEMVERSKAK